MKIEEFIANTNGNRTNTFVADDKTFGLAIANSVGTNLTGTSYSDYMLGGGGNDTLTAGAGDSLFGGAGDDSLNYISTGSKFDGGAGTDTLSASPLTSGVEINLYDSTISNIEMLVGSSLADVLRGSSIANTLSGGIGNDQLWGGTGAVADSLVGGAGADTFYFGIGEGDDVIAKEATVADLRYDAVQLSGINFADLTFGYSGGNDAVIGFAASTGYTGTLTIEEFISNTNTGRVNTFYAADKTFGLAIANSVGTNLTGTSYSDYMLGAAGNDTLTAGAGDSLFGGAGDDSMFYISTGGKFDGGRRHRYSERIDLDIGSRHQPLRQHDQQR